MPFDTRDANRKRGAPRIKLVAANSNRPLADAISGILKLPLTRVHRAALRGHGSVRGGAGEHARRGRLRPAVDLLSRQRQPDGAADPGRRAEALDGAAHHRRHALLRLCAPGSPPRPAHADLGQAGRQPDRARRRRPGHDGRPARRPDPGLLRHPDRQPVRRPRDGARHPGALRHLQPGGRIARRRRRGARARARQAHRRADRHLRQAPRAGRRVRGHERDRRRQGQALPS